MHISHKERATERMVGLDIGEHGASASLLGFGRGGSISLKAAGSVEFDMNANEREVAAAIRKLWKRGGFGSYTVCVGVHSPSMLWQTFSYPDLTDEELEAALHLNAEEYTQMSSDALVMDMHLYETDGGEREGFYVAVPRDELTRLTRIIEMANLFPVIVDVSAMAVANLFIRFHEEELREDALCVVCFDGHHADILVLQDSECIYARSIAAHSTQIDTVSEYMSEALVEVIEQSRMAMSSDPVTAIYFSGNLARLDETMKATEELTGLPVTYWNPLENVKLTHHVKRSYPDMSEGAGKLAGSLGLGLRRVM
jgi:Tfp pilus assembly PilM family ATPase